MNKPLKFFAFIAPLLLAVSGLAAAPRRVVSLLPSHSEIVAALGAESLLVGVTDVEKEGDFPRVPRVGGVKPNWEVLISLKPDVILADAAHKRYGDNFKRFRLPVLYLESTHAKGFEDVFALIREVGRILERGAAAEKMVADLRARVEATRRRVPPGPGPSVYFEVWPRPLQAVGPVSLQGFLLKQAGGRNILPETPQEMPLVSLEWVPRESPDVILHTGVVESAEIARRPGWAAVPAVAKRHIYIVDRDKFSRAGPHIVDAFEELIALFYSQGVAAP